jgi:mannose-6-phosphate isomerase-like protein (cupin superfamily)
MTDSTPYTVVNLKEVEDVAPGAGLAPNLEARFARKPLELAQSGLTYFRMAPGFREPFGHRHRTQEEIYVVVSGSMRMKLDDDMVELRAWDAIRIAPATVRGREAGPNGAEVLLFGAPQAEGDADLLREWWTD